MGSQFFSASIAAFRAAQWPAFDCCGFRLLLGPPYVRRYLPVRIFTPLILLVPSTTAMSFSLANILIGEPLKQ
jgi:hypothetical protein